jgi:predicted PurR-regulated permease PerM
MPSASSASERAPLADFTYRVLIAVGIVALAILTWRLATVFLLIFGSIVLAAALRALSGGVAHYTPLSERWSLALVVVLLAIGLGVGGWLIGAQVAHQFGQLVELLPDALERVRAWLGQSTLGKAVLDWLGPVKESAGASVSGVMNIAGSTFGALANLVLVVFLALYLAADPGLYRRGVVALIPPAGRTRARSALDRAGSALRKWLIGQLGAMLAVGVLTFLGLWLLGTPLALSLALITGVLEFVPFIGPILAAIPAVLIGFTEGPADALYIALLYFGIQQLEGYVIMPIVQKWAVALPPALGLVAVVMFGLLFGLPGILLAVPLMVVAMELIDELYVEAALDREPVRS